MITQYISFHLLLPKRSQHPLYFASVGCKIGANGLEQQSAYVILNWGIILPLCWQYANWHHKVKRTVDTRLSRAAYLESSSTPIVTSDQGLVESNAGAQSSGNKEPHVTCDGRTVGMEVWRHALLPSAISSGRMSEWWVSM